MRNSYWTVLIIITVFLGGQTKADTVLPANLDGPGFMVSMVSQLYAQSPTFHAQCDRLSAAPNVTVRLQLDVSIRQSCRAFTIIKRRHGAVCAEVHLPPPSTQFPELVGHEFEHIVEQLEGLDLRALSRMRDSGVHEVEFQLFETDRAQRAGKIVAEEVRLARAGHPAAD
jgi:hypothetical protein